jgi:hypothetical protein
MFRQDNMMATSVASWLECRVIRPFKEVLNALEIIDYMAEPQMGVPHELWRCSVVCGPKARRL